MNQTKQNSRIVFYVFYTNAVSFILPDSASIPSVAVILFLIERKIKSIKEVTHASSTLPAALHVVAARASSTNTDALTYILIK